MKMKLSAVALVTAMCLSAVGAHAGGTTSYDVDKDQGFYLGATGGVSFFHEVNSEDFNKQVHTGFNVGGFAGYQFNQHWRTDLTIDYTRNNMDPVGDIKTHMNQLHVLVNGYFDYPINEITPFVGLGLGYSGISFTGSAPKVVGDGKNVQAVTSNTYGGIGWQLTAGANYSLNHNLDLGLAYRLMATNATIEGTRINTILNNIIGASISYRF